MTTPESQRGETLVDRLRQHRFGFGTGPLGGLYAPVTDADAADALAAAWAAGVRFYDTAPHYGAGLAERRLGAFLRDVPRDEVIVSTKVGRVLAPANDVPAEQEGFFDGAPFVRVYDYSRAGILRSLEDSVARTGLDRFDLVLIHDPDDHWEPAVTQAYPALAQLRDEGVVGAIGVGMNQWQMLARFVRETDLDAVLLAGRYTLLDRSAADVLLPLCLDRSVAVIAGGVFNSGILANPTPDSHYDYAPPPAATLARALELQRACERYGTPLAAAALQYPLRHDAVEAVLVGARSADEIIEDIALAAHPVPDELWDLLAAPANLPLAR
jgi:D-threo-aldose 1-dehydrogenase